MVIRKFFIIRRIIVTLFGVLASACTITPKPICPNEWYQRAQKEIHCMFAQQPAVADELDFSQAMARGLQYNLDMRINNVKSAIQTNQLKLAQLALLPEFNGLMSNYSRNNDNATFGSNPDGTPSQQVAFGADNTILSNRTEIKWNLLDLGRGYIRAKEEGERLLIAQEESRKQLQKLVQDLRVTYWRAYSAQQLMGELQEFQGSLIRAKEQLAEALIDKMIPKEALLNYQSSLLDGNRRLVQLEDKLSKAELQFKYLINIPPDQPIVLKKPPSAIIKIQDLTRVDFEKLDAITLVNRPELRSQDYQRRIAKLGIKAAIFQALPTLTINAGNNYNSNSFLLNNLWSDRLVDASWNFFSLFSLPNSLKKARTQTRFESLKLMALTLGALNETRLAYTHYQTLAKETMVARKQTENAKRMYYLAHNRQVASLASKQQVLLAKLHYIFAKMDEIILLSDLSTALGELYLFSGFDVLPLEATKRCPEEVLVAIEHNLFMQDTVDFKEYVNITYEKLFVCGQSDS